MIMFIVCGLIIIAAFPLAAWLRREGDLSWQRHQILEHARPITERFVQLQLWVADSLTPTLERVAEAAAEFAAAFGGVFAWQEAVSSELVRLTLGGRPDRPELRTDVPREGSR